MKRGSIILFVLILFSLSCKDDKVYIPKPRMYPKVEYPEKSYQTLNILECPFEMDVPKYFKYVKDSTSVKKLQLKPSDVACWFDLYSEKMNSHLHLSYFDIAQSAGFDKLVADAFEMVDKHNIKANYRDEVKVNDKSRRLHGIIFEVDGPVATPLQFFLTDSTQHFLRGSLYFNSQVNPDSIAPVYAFLKEDVNHFLETFKWKN